MEALDWLRHHEGLFALDAREHDAIRDFTLLWSLFEARAMETEGSPGAVMNAVDRIEKAGLIVRDPIADALAFWRERYWQGGAPTPAFDGLRLRPNPHRDLVVAVLNGTRDGSADCLKAMQLIVLRLRNNLFHGVKWATHLADQEGNFSHAGQVLMAAIDMNRPIAAAAHG